MTDQPAAVAWYADRRAVWLYQREDDWDLLERAVGPVDAVYVTPEITRMAAEEPGDGWIWVASPRGIYRGLMPVYNAPLAGTLRVRPEGWIPRPRDPETPR
jgi:hypothetical protein